MDVVLEGSLEGGRWRWLCQLRVVSYSEDRRREEKKILATVLLAVLAPRSLPTTSTTTRSIILHLPAAQCIYVHRRPCNHLHQARLAVDHDRCHLIPASLSPIAPKSLSKDKNKHPRRIDSCETTENDGPFLCAIGNNFCSHERICLAPALPSFPHLVPTHNVCP